MTAEAEPEPVDWYHAFGDDDGEVRYGSADASHFVKLGGLPLVRISTAAREIVAFSRVPVARETMTHLVVDQALPLAIAQSGRLVLHASCVERDGVAIAFAGSSGSGKSTLATAFCRQGWRLVSDDALAFASIAPPRVDAAYHSVRLWSDSLRWTGESERLLPRVAEGMDKRLLAMPRSPGTHALRTICLVKPAESASRHTIRKPSLGETMLGLAACSFRLDTRDRARLASEFDSLFRLSQASTVAIVDVARGFDKIESLTKLIEDDLGAE
jgi:hypothetical protein